MFGIPASLTADMAWSWKSSDQSFKACCNRVCKVTTILSLVFDTQ